MGKEEKRKDLQSFIVIGVLEMRDQGSFHYY